MACCGKKSKYDLKKSGSSAGKFIPDYRLKPLTEKFYARHEYLDMNDQRNTNALIYFDEITKRQAHDWRQERLVPITENQSYGWMERLATTYPEELDRLLLFHPKIQDKEMRILAQISLELQMRRKLGLTR